MSILKFVVLIDSNGTRMVEYEYDAWGNHTVSGIYTDLGKLNPFRYRSYFYDTETQLYYLKSRYYDPYIGRFISMDDASYADPETVGGLNLYAYCGNNPVMNVDPDGHFFGLIVQFLVSAASYVGLAVASLFDSDIKADMESINWNPFNTDEQTVLNSSKVSFYKGAPVFRTNMSRSGSFYAIFLDNTSNENDLRHERGHGWQAMGEGPLIYGITVGISSPPSLGPWYQNGNGDYYAAPWETFADMLGGVNNRAHSNEEKLRAYLYTFTSCISPAASYLFLLWA